MLLVLVLYVALPLGCIFCAYKINKYNKKKGITGRAFGLKFVQGIPGIIEGQSAYLILYKDKLTINEQQIIPLNRIRQAELFKCQHSLQNKTSGY